MTNTLELIERIRADARVCGVVAYARGGGDDFVLKKRFRARVESASRGVVRRFGRAASRDGGGARGYAAENTRNVSDDDVSFLEEADALHALASALEGASEDDAAGVASLSAFLSRPTGRSRVERRDVDVRFRFPVIDDGAFRVVALRPPSGVTFSAPERGEKKKEEKTFQSKKDVEKIEAEAEAEKRRARLERATPFKLGVSAEEFLARSRVVLPFEHQGGYAYGPDPDVLHRASAETYDRGDFLRGRAAWRAAATARRENRKAPARRHRVRERLGGRRVGRNRTRTRSWTRTRTAEELLRAKKGSAYSKVILFNLKTKTSLIIHTSTRLATWKVCAV